MASRPCRTARTARIAPSVFGAVLAGACILHAAPARADVTSFLSAGGGYGIQRDGVAKSNDSAGTMSLALGVGTDPIRKVVLAGMFRTTVSFGLGTDFSLAARIANGGFARGGWGLALDVGPGYRFFGNGEHGRWPLFAQLTAGAPWGVQLGVGTQVLKLGGNDPSAIGFMAVLELDLLRLTVMRQGSTDKYWPNPAPAGGKMSGKGPLPKWAGLLW